MKKRKLSIKKVLIAIFILIIIVIISLVGFFNFNLTAPSKDKEFIPFEITEGTTTYQIIENLKSEGLIRNSTIFKVYLKLFEKDLVIKAGTYNLSSSMDVKDIIEEFKNENFQGKEEITITFKEGISIPKMKKILISEMNITEKEIDDTLKDKEYLNSLIEKYWFLDDDILNKKLYYPLEGYLFPNTYNFFVDASVKDIFNKLLDQTEVVLNKYKEDIEKNKYSVHELLTLASIIQTEGVDLKSFKKVSSVLYNRINSNMKLECCTTAYYGAKLIQGEDDFGDADSQKNAYNTYVIEGLPVGPIANPGEDAIAAALNPSKTDYLYFLSDSNLKLYFFDNYYDHQAKQQELISKGMWAGS